MLHLKKINKYNESYSEVTFDDFTKQIKEPFDFNFLIPYSLGCSQRLHKEINQLYAKDKELFYKAYKESPFYNDYRILALSVLNQDATQKLIGIFFTLDENQKSSLTLSLIKVGFKFIYQYINQTNAIDIYEIRDLSLKYAKKHNLSIIYGSCHVFAITLYLCSTFNRKICLEDTLSSVNLIKSSFLTIEYNYSFNALGNVNDSEIKDFINKYKDFPLKKSSALSLNHFITDLNNIFKNDKLKNSQFQLTNEEINNCINEHDFSTGLTKIATFLQLSGINIIDLQNITPISYSDITRMLNYTFYILKDDKSDLTVGNFLGILVLLDALVKDYKTVKNKLLNTSIEETLLEVQNLRFDYHKKIKSLESIESDLIRENESQKNLIKQQQAMINKLEKEKELTLAHAESINHQNIILSQMINEIENINKIINEATDSKKISYAEMINYLSMKKIIIIGGDTKWQSNLSKVLTNIKYLSPTDVNKNLKYIINFDVIFFNPSVNNHSMFYKIQNTLKNSSTPLCYCGIHTNIEKSIEHIYFSLHEKLNS